MNSYTPDPQKIPKEAQMICDNCGQRTTYRAENEFTVMKMKFGWPPLRRVIRNEMWCRRCDNADHPDSSAVSVRKRRKLDFEDND